jgi:uncharacterized protein YgiM (DUF1202 family)
MAISVQAFYPIPLLMIAVITVAGCKKPDEDLANVDDLPDLAKQARPYVTAENTRVRTGPGPQFRAIAEIPANAKIHVVGRDGEWALIISKKGNAPGFVELGTIRPGQEEKDEKQDSEFGDPPTTTGRYEAVTDTQVRGGPGLHHPVIAEIAKGTKLTVVENSNGWLRVESRRGNKPGYVDATHARALKE